MRGPTAPVEQQDIEQVVRLLTEIRDLLSWNFRDDPIKKPTNFMPLPAPPVEADQ